MYRFLVGTGAGAALYTRSFHCGQIFAALVYHDERQRLFLATSLAPAFPPVTKAPRVSKEPCFLYRATPSSSKWTGVPSRPNNRRCKYIPAWILLQQNRYLFHRGRGSAELGVPISTPGNKLREASNSSSTQRLVGKIKYVSLELPASTDQNTSSHLYQCTSLPLRERREGAEGHSAPRRVTSG